MKQFILSFGDTGNAEIITIKLLMQDIVCFHMTSRQPYLCPKTMKRRPCLCPKPVLWELNSFLMQTLSFVPINLHRCWPREWKHRITLEIEKRKKLRTERKNTHSVTKGHLATSNRLSVTVKGKKIKNYNKTEYFGTHWNGCINWSSVYHKFYES